MPRNRCELESFEEQHLAPYAQKSSESRGREHPEPQHEIRTEFQRDRDRVVHSRSFRRLEYKTQVFLNGAGDHLRTRMTHTIEVAAISRTLARALRLNEDLAETIALAHDLGHSPFGHSGERELNRLMRPHGGFEHNRQSLRVVSELEQKYPQFDGLNLTWEVREGLAKHSTQFDKPGRHADFHFHSPSLEAQIANLADEIAYYSHDLDDGLEAGLITEEQLSKVSIWRTSSEMVRRKYGKLDPSRKHYFVIRCLINEQVKDVIATSEKAILAAAPNSADEVRKLKRHLVRYSPMRRIQNIELRKFLYRNLYFNPVVHEPNVMACRMMNKLFHLYVQNVELLGNRTKSRIRKTGPYRAVCDYIAGMTDRFAISEYERFFGKAQLNIQVK